MKNVSHVNAHRDLMDSPNVFQETFSESQKQTGWSNVENNNMYFLFFYPEIYSVEVQNQTSRILIQNVILNVIWLCKEMLAIMQSY